jgi:hypothetical protein
MDSVSMIRIVAGAIALLLVIVLIQRRRRNID